MKLLRTALEILGVGVFLASQYVVVLVYWLGSSLRGVHITGYWVSIGLGYLVMIAVAIQSRRLLGSAPGRQRFDSWLLAWPLAVVLSSVLVLLHWPLDYRGWDGHGMGASGGEANAALVPWLHTGAWFVVTRLWSAFTSRRERGRRG